MARRAFVNYQVGAYDEGERSRGSRRDLKTEGESCSRAARREEDRQVSRVEAEESNVSNFLAGGRRSSGSQGGMCAVRLFSGVVIL
jgi:hypothetical protein